MIQSNELTALILATGVLVSLLAFRRSLRAIAAVGYLHVAYACLYAGLVCTVLEDVFWEQALNILEHLANLACTVALVAWMRAVVRGRRDDLWPS